MSNNWGGKRTNSGRKPSHPSKPVRVPLEYADKIPQLIQLANLVADWKNREENRIGTSPRWDKLCEFLKEASDLDLI